MDTTIGISDPLPVFRGGLRSALTKASFVVDEPADVVEWAGAGCASESRAVLLSLATHSDWAVLDHLHDCRPEIVVVTLLHQPSHQSYRDALARGALSAAPRAAPSSLIVEVVRAAIERQSLLPASVSSALAASSGGAGGAGGRGGLPLADEERRWLRELAEGVSVEDLAWRFGYSRRTMYRRLSGVYRQLGANRREGALIAAIRNGLI